MSKNCCVSSIVDADCIRKDGKFLLSSTEGCLPDLFTVRFRAPADYVAGDLIVFKDQELPVRMSSMAEAADDLFKANAVVRCDIDMVQKLAFFGQGGDGGESVSHNSRRLLTGDLTLYIRKDGNDSNSGMSEDKAFLTWGRAHRELCSIDGSGYAVTVQFGVGVWEELITCGGQSYVGIPNLYLKGAGSNSTTIHCTNATSQPLFVGYGSCYVHVNNLKLKGGYQSIRVCYGGVVSLSDVWCDTPSTYYIRSLFGATVFLGGTIMLSGLNATGFSAAISLQNSATVQIDGSTELVFSGTNKAENCVVVTRNSSLYINAAVNVTGSFVGRAYNIYLNGTVSTNGKAFPGDAPGVVNTGGQYVP